MSLADEHDTEPALDAFLAVDQLGGVALVVAPDDASLTQDDPRVQVLPVGGASRAASVHNGLRALLQAGADASDWVLVHDAARCLVTPGQVAALIEACRDDAVGGLLALPLPDTLKAAQTDDGVVRVAATLARDDKWLAQTPQMFRLGELEQALAAAEAGGYAGITDEASAIEAQGRRPLLVRGSAQNFKVTYPEDFALAEALLRLRASAPAD